MKDIKQYFANGKNIIDKEIVIDPDNVVKQEKQEQEETIATDRCKRMKIRVSRNGSASRMCDIIKSRKSDPIDKMSSLFNGEMNNGQIFLQDGTSKSGLIESDIKQPLKKVSLILTF